MTKSKQSIKFDKSLNIPVKWFWRMTKLQVYYTVYHITERNIKFAQYIPGYYEQVQVDFESLKKLVAQITAEHTLQTETDLTKKYDNEIS